MKYEIGIKNDFFLVKNKKRFFKKRKRDRKHCSINYSPSKTFEE